MTNRFIDTIRQNYLTKQREGRGMATEIRIEKAPTCVCEYEDCRESALRWVLDCKKTLFCVCKEHGEAIKRLIVGWSSGITITGGYDDEPKSRLAAQRDRLVKSITDFDGKGVLLDILDHLIEKE